MILMNFNNLEALLLEVGFVLNEPEKILLDDRTSNILSEMGIVGLAVIEFDLEIGPIVRGYYIGEKSRFIPRLLDDPGLVAEISIIGKHANELVTPQGEKILIMPYKATDNGGRIVTNYVIFELGGKKKREAKKLIKNLAKNMKNKKDKTYRDILKKILLS